MICAWLIGAIIRFSWLPLVNISLVGINWHLLCLGWVICAVGLVFYEVIFTLLVQATLRYTLYFKYFTHTYFLQAMLYICLLALQQLFLTKQFFLFLGQNKGLATNNIFLPITSLLLNLFPNLMIYNHHNTNFLFVPKLASINYYFLPTTKTNNFFKLLINATQALDNKQKKIFLAPESFLDYDIPIFEINLWQQVLAKQDFIITGLSTCNFQTALVVQKKEQTFLHKELLCPIYEEFFFTAGPKTQLKYRLIDKTHTLLICSEFFLAPLNFIWPESTSLILLVKEKMFPLFFYKILLSYAIFFALYNHKQIIWVDYNGLRIINFSGKVKM